jgi:hypothetical protein
MDLLSRVSRLGPASPVLTENARFPRQWGGMALVQVAKPLERVRLSAQDDKLHSADESCTRTCVAVRSHGIAKRLENQVAVRRLQVWNSRAGNSHVDERGSGPQPAADAARRRRDGVPADIGALRPLLSTAWREGMNRRRPARFRSPLSAGECPWFRPVHPLSPGSRLNVLRAQRKPTTASSKSDQDSLGDMDGDD